jgi:hypothetical protein
MLVRKALKLKRLKAFADGSLDPNLVGSPWCQSNATGADAANGLRSARSALVVQENGTPARAASHLLEDGAVELVDYSEALRRKENYLALLRQLEYEEKSGALIELAVAEAVVFDIFRGYRDALLNWPTRIGPLLATDLDVDVELVVTALTGYVREHLSELGEPSADGFGAQR